MRMYELCLAGYPPGMMRTLKRHRGQGRHGAPPGDGGHTDRFERDEEVELGVARPERASVLDFEGAKSGAHERERLLAIGDAGFEIGDLDAKLGELLGGGAGSGRDFEAQLQGGR